MAKYKNLTLNGEMAVDIDGTYSLVCVKNNTQGTVVVAFESGKTALSEDAWTIASSDSQIVSIPRESADRVYIAGTGTVQIYFANVQGEMPFKSASASSGGSGGGSIVSYIATTTSGKEIGNLMIDGTVNTLYCPESGGEHNWYGECTTAQNTQQKVVTIDGFTSADLVKGTAVTIRFTNASHPTYYNSLNINNTGAKTIKKYGTTDSGGAWNAGSVITLVYDGTYWQMADYQQNTDESVKQTLNNNTNSNYPILFKSDTTTQERVQGTQFNSNVTVNPSTGTLTATKFVGDGSGITGLPITYEDNTTTAQINNGAIKIGTITVNGTDVDLYCRGSGSNTIADIDDDLPIDKTYCPMSVTDVFQSLYNLRGKILSEEITPIDLRVQALEGVKVKTKTVTATHATASKAWGLGLVVSDYPNIIHVDIDSDSYVCSHFKSADKTRWYTTIAHYSTPGTFVETGTFTFTVYYI